MTTFTSFNTNCFCDDENDCALMICGHACHPKCVKTLSACPWCRANIVFIQPSVQRAYHVDEKKMPSPQPPQPPQVQIQAQPQPLISVVLPPSPGVGMDLRLYLEARARNEEQRLRALERQREKRALAKAQKRQEMVNEARRLDEEQQIYQEAARQLKVAQNQAHVI